jgi:hypothetical protein
MAMPERRMASRREPIGYGKLHCSRLLPFGTLEYRNCLTPVDRFCDGRGIRVFTPVSAKHLKSCLQLAASRKDWIARSGTSNPCGEKWTGAPTGRVVSARLGSDACASSSKLPARVIGGNPVMHFRAPVQIVDRAAWVARDVIFQQRLLPLPRHLPDVWQDDWA